MLPLLSMYISNFPADTVVPPLYFIFSIVLALPVFTQVPSALKPCLTAFAASSSVVSASFITSGVILLPDIVILPLLNPATPPSIPYFAVNLLSALFSSVQPSIAAFSSFLPTIPPACVANASFCAAVLVLVAV